MKPSHFEKILEGVSLFQHVTVILFRFLSPLMVLLQFLAFDANPGWREGLSLFLISVAHVGLWLMPLPPLSCTLENKATRWLYQGLRKLPSLFLLLVFTSAISGCVVFLFDCFDRYHTEVSKWEKSDE